MYFQHDELWSIADLRRHYILTTTDGAHHIVFSNAELCHLDHARLKKTYTGQDNTFGLLTPSEREILYSFIKKATVNYRVRKCKEKKAQEEAMIALKLKQKKKKADQLQAQIQEYERRDDRSKDAEALARVRERLCVSEEEVSSHILHIHVIIILTCLIKIIYYELIVSLIYCCFSSWPCEGECNIPTVSSSRPQK